MVMKLYFLSILRKDGKNDTFSEKFAMSFSTVVYLLGIQKNLRGNKALPGIGFSRFVTLD